MAIVFNICFVFAISHMYFARVYLGVHSLAQVTVGALLGLAIGIAWHWLAGVTALRSHGFSRLRHSALGMWCKSLFEDVDVVGSNACSRCKVLLMFTYFLLL